MTGEDLVSQCLQALNAIEAQFMVVGSFSSNYYGIPRSTKGADIVVHVRADEISRLRHELEGVLRLDPQMGFETIGGTTKHKIHADASAFVVEIFELSDDPFDRERFERRVSAAVGGIPTFLPTAEDVIIQKLRWSRPKDLGDVRDVLSIQQDNLDWPYILKWCDEHGSRDALDEVCEELGITPG